MPTSKASRYRIFKIRREKFPFCHMSSVIRCPLRKILMVSVSSYLKLRLSTASLLPEEKVLECNVYKLQQPKLESEGEAFQVGSSVVPGVGHFLLFVSEQARTYDRQSIHCAEAIVLLSFKCGLRILKSSMLSI